MIFDTGLFWNNGGNAFSFLAFFIHPMVIYPVALS